MASGEAWSASVSISRLLEMSWFWQKAQARLQPAVPNDSTGVPGRKWFSGFFSIGSTQNPDERPQVVSTTSPAFRRPHEAQPPLPLAQHALARTHIAPHPPVGHGGPGLGAHGAGGKEVAGGHGANLSLPPLSLGGTAAQRRSRRQRRPRPAGPAEPPDFTYNHL